MAGTRSVYFDEECEIIIQDYALEKKILKRGQPEFSRTVRALIYLAKKGESILVDSLRTVISNLEADLNKMAVENNELHKINMDLKAQLRVFDEELIEVKEVLHRKNKE